MDDAGFEQAVAELTPDSGHLIAGFAGGMKYDKPQTSIGLKEYILQDPNIFIQNWFINQKKLYTQNLPRLLLGNAAALYNNASSQFFYKNYLYLIVLLIPIFLLISGIIQMYKQNQRDFLFIFGSFFLIASSFFTLFFTLDRYFLLFLPLLLLVVVYGIHHLDKTLSFSWTGFSTKYIGNRKFTSKNFLKGVLSLIVIGIFLL